MARWTKPDQDETAARRLMPGDPAPDAFITLADGTRHALSDLWREGPLALVFLRHLGCVFCREAVARLSALQPALAVAGARAVAVSLANMEQTAAFCEQRAPAILCAVDPDGMLYDRYDIRRGGARQLVGPAVIAAGVRSLLRGHTQSRAQGDVYRLPGAFVIAPTGQLTLVHYAAHAGDHVGDEAILSAISQAASPGRVSRARARAG